MGAARLAFAVALDAAIVAAVASAVVDGAAVSFLSPLPRELQLLPVDGR